MAQTELFQRAFEQLKAGKYDVARQLFAEDEEKVGTAADTRAQLKSAEAKLAAGDLKTAALIYESLLDRNPSLPDLYLGLTRISLFTSELDAARAHATAAVRLAPGNPLAWTMMGLVHEAEGDVQGAVGHLRTASEQGGSVFLCQFNYGRVLTQLNRAVEAVTPLSKATELEPKNPDAWSALGMALRQLKQYEKALAAFEKAKDLAPRVADGWATLADVLFEVKEFKAARAILDDALKACGDLPALLEKAVACALMLDDPEGAVAYVERELKVVPRHEQGWLNLANLALLAKDGERSEAAARTLTELNPKNWEAWYHLGNLYEAIPKPKEAEAFYRSAVACAPGNWKPLANLAALLVQSTDAAQHGEAVSLLEQSLTTVPSGEWRVHYNLALAHTRLGHTEKALALARQVQAGAAPADPMGAEAKKLESNLLEKR